MEDQNSNPTSANNEPVDHFTAALQTIKESHGDKISEKDEERVLGIREAVKLGDKVKAEEHLIATKLESSWLYEELMKHPEISIALREMSIFGL